MGVNNNGQQQQPQPAMTPQQQQLKALQTTAMTPYSGTARGGGAAQGVAQLAAALMARNKQAALLKGNPGGAQQPLPVAQTPVPAAVPPGGAPTSPGNVYGARMTPSEQAMAGPGGPVGGAPVAPGMPAQMPQAQSPLMQSTPGLTPGMMGPP